MPKNIASIHAKIQADRSITAAETMACRIFFVNEARKSAAKQLQTIVNQLNADCAINAQQITILLSLEGPV